jgi:hypothetical protein
MRIDSTVMHTDDVQVGSGAEFYGSPIREVNPIAVEVREELDMQARARLGMGVETAPVELLPGEVIKDNVIRRETAAEVVGEQFYAEKPQVSFEDSISGLQEPSYWDDYTVRCV